MLFWASSGPLASSWTLFSFRDLLLANADAERLSSEDIFFFFDFFYLSSLEELEDLLEESESESDSEQESE